MSQKLSKAMSQLSTTDPASESSSSNTTIPRPTETSSVEPPQNETVEGTSEVSQVSSTEPEPEPLTAPDPAPYQIKPHRVGGGESPLPAPIYDPIDWQVYTPARGPEIISIGEALPEGMTKLFADTVRLYPNYEITIHHPLVDGELGDQPPLGMRSLSHLRGHLRWLNSQKHPEDSAQQRFARYQSTAVLAPLCGVPGVVSYYCNADDVYDQLEVAEGWRQPDENRR